MKREALSHPLSIAGVVLATASAVVFITLVIAELLGMIENPYAGLVIFIAIPAVFVMALLLIPAGVWLRRRSLARHPGSVADWPVVDFRITSVRRTALMLTALTAVNIVIVLLAGYGGLHWMDSPQFCGQVCHTTMHPQFAAWSGGPHARIACASCHIGEGAAGFIHAKLAGTRQLVHVLTNNVPTPVPPGAHLEAGTLTQTCSRCHQAARSSGDRVRVIREYAEDETNSETLTVLQMHVGGAAAPRAIHWHADPNVRVEYVATSGDRQTIPYVKVTDAKGQVKEYVAADAKRAEIDAGVRRTMECGDCHSTVGHPIAATPEKAVDQAIAAAHVSRELPFARREGVRLMKASYQDEGAAMAAIDRELRDFYKSHGGTVNADALARAVAAFQDVYRRNVYAPMKVAFGTYPDNKGHVTSTGCFRCHDDSHAASDGSKISADCDYCHRQIETGGSQ